jgi:hypothetical protein
VADANDLADLGIAACDYVHLSGEADRVDQHLVAVYIADRQKRLFAALSLRCALEEQSPIVLGRSGSSAIGTSSMCQATYQICRLILQILGADLQTTLN